MRTLTETQLAEQRKVRNFPCMKVTVGSDTYYTGDPGHLSRILALNHIERVYGGQAIVRIELATGQITDDYRGKELQISYGFVTGYPETGGGEGSGYNITGSICFGYDGVSYKNLMAIFTDGQLYWVPVTGIAKDILLDGETNIDCSLLQISRDGVTTYASVIYQNGDNADMLSYFTDRGYSVDSEIIGLNVFVASAGDYDFYTPDGWTRPYWPVPTITPVDGSNTDYTAHIGSVTFNGTTYSPGMLHLKPYGTVSEYLDYRSNIWWFRKNIYCSLIKYFSLAPSDGGWHNVAIYYEEGDLSQALSDMEYSVYECLPSSIQVYSTRKIFSYDDGDYTFLSPIGWSCGTPTIPGHLYLNGYDINRVGFSYDGKDYSYVGLYLYSGDDMFECPCGNKPITGELNISCSLLDCVAGEVHTYRTIYYESGHIDDVVAWLLANNGETATADSTTVDMFTVNDGIFLFQSYSSSWTVLESSPEAYSRRLSFSPMRYDGQDYNTYTYNGIDIYDLLIYYDGSGHYWYGSNPGLESISVGVYKALYNDTWWWYGTYWYNEADKAAVQALLAARYSSANGFSDYEWVADVPNIITYADGEFTYNETEDWSLISAGHNEPPAVETPDVITRYRYSDDDQHFDIVPLIIKLESEYTGGGHFVLEGTAEYSPTPPLRVYNQRYYSEPGINYLELECVDKWQVLDNLPVTGIETGGSIGLPPYWFATMTIAEIFDELLANTGISVVVVSSDGYFDNALFKPYYRCPYATTPIATVLIDLISQTLNSLRFNEDGDLEVVRIDVQPEEYDYIYSLLDAGYHRFFTNNMETKEVVPNRVVFCESLPTTESYPAFTGYADDDEAIARWNSGGFNGVFTRLYVNPTIASESDAELQADNMLTRIQLNVASDVIEVPMNIGQELLDWIQVQDERQGSEEDGLVGQLQRVFFSGHYRMTIQMGGITVGLSTEVTNQWYDKNNAQQNIEEPPPAEQYTEDIGELTKPEPSVEHKGPSVIESLLGPIGLTHWAATEITKEIVGPAKSYIESPIPAARAYYNFQGVEGKTVVFFTTEGNKAHVVPQDMTPAEFIQQYIDIHGTLPNLTGDTNWTRQGWTFNPDSLTLEKK